jgi:PAS domain S-box-containing protein
VTDWNPAAAELFGYSAEEALGQPLDELVLSDSGPEEGREIMKEAIREGRAQRITRRRRRDGTLVHVELMLVPLTELTGEQREFAEVVRTSGDALLHVIDDILDYSKIEAGKLDLELEPFSLRECVEGAMDIVAPRAWAKRIELGCLIDDTALPGSSATRRAFARCS